MKDKWHLLAEDDGEGNSSGGGGDETSKLKTTLERVKDERNSIRQKLSSLEEKFKKVDIEEYDRLKQEAADRETGKKTLETQMSEMKTNHEKQQAATVKDRDSWKTKYEALVVDVAIRDAFIDSDGRTELGGNGFSYQDLIAMAVRDRVALKDGKIQVLDKDGFEMTDSDAKPYTLELLMKDLAESGATSACFKPKNNNSGGGMQESVKGGVNLGVDVRTKLASMSPQDRIAYAKENNIPLDKPIA